MGPAVRKTEAVPKNRPVPMTPMEGGFKLPSHCCEHKGVYLRCYTRSSTNNVCMRETHCSYLIIVMCLSFIWRLRPFFSSTETVMTSASTFEDPFFTDSGSLFSTAMDVALAGDRDGEIANEVVVEVLTVSPYIRPCPVYFRRSPYATVSRTLLKPSSRDRCRYSGK